MNLIMNICCLLCTYFAVSEDCEEQWKALVNELCRVVVRPNLQEVLQELVNDGLETMLMRRR